MSGEGFPALEVAVGAVADGCQGEDDEQDHQGHQARGDQERYPGLQAQRPARTPQRRGTAGQRSIFAAEALTVVSRVERLTRFYTNVKPLAPHRSENQLWTFGAAEPCARSLFYSSGVANMPRGRSTQAPAAASMEIIMPVGSVRFLDSPAAFCRPTRRSPGRSRTSERGRSTTSS